MTIQKFKCIMICLSIMQISPASPDNDSIREIRDSTKILAESSTKLEKSSKRLEYLTIVLTVLTIILAIPVIGDSFLKILLYLR